MSGRRFTSNALRRDLVSLCAVTMAMALGCGGDARKRLPPGGGAGGSADGGTGGSAAPPAAVSGSANAGGPGAETAGTTNVGGGSGAGGGGRTAGGAATAGTTATAGAATVAGAAGALTCSGNVLPGEPVCASTSTVHVFYCEHPGAESCYGEWRAEPCASGMRCEEAACQVPGESEPRCDGVTNTGATRCVVEDPDHEFVCDAPGGIVGWWPRRCPVGQQCTSSRCEPHVRESCDHDLKPGETWCDPDRPGSVFTCVDPGLRGDAQWLEEPCTDAKHCVDDECQAVAACGDPCTECMMTTSVGRGLLATRQGPDTPCADRNALFSGWCGSNPVDCLQLEITACHRLCACGSDCAACVFAQRQDLVPFFSASQGIDCSSVEEKLSYWGTQFAPRGYAELVLRRCSTECGCGDLCTECQLAYRPDWFAVHRKCGGTLTCPGEDAESQAALWCESHPAACGEALATSGPCASACAPP